MYNDFMVSVSKPTKALYEEWAKEYKKKSNGIDVFPKLPSMLKAYEEKMGEEYGNQSDKQEPEHQYIGPTS